MHITELQAEKMIAAAKAKAIELNARMIINVVDARANILAFARMDGAPLDLEDVAFQKAITARFFDFSNGHNMRLSLPGGSLFDVEESSGKLVSFHGGIPVTNADGVVIGAIGVSGSTFEKDHAVAEAGINALFHTMH